MSAPITAFQLKGHSAFTVRTSVCVSKMLLQWNVSGVPAQPGTCPPGLLPGRCPLVEQHPLPVLHSVQGRESAQSSLAQLLRNSSLNWTLVHLLKKKVHVCTHFSQLKIKPKRICCSCQALAHHTTVSLCCQKFFSSFNWHALPNEVCKEKN